MRYYLLEIMKFHNLVSALIFQHDILNYPTCLIRFFKYHTLQQSRMYILDLICSPCSFIKVLLMSTELFGVEITCKKLILKYVGELSTFDQERKHKIAHAVI